MNTFIFLTKKLNERMNKDVFKDVHNRDFLEIVHKFERMNVKNDKFLSPPKQNAILFKVKFV